MASRHGRSATVVPALLRRAIAADDKALIDGFIFHTMLTSAGFRAQLAAPSAKRSASRRSRRS